MLGIWILQINHPKDLYFEKKYYFCSRMARECIVTGKKPRVGNNVSHANNRTKRRFDINLQRKKFYIPETGEWITLRLTARAIKTISKKGISEVLKELKKQGYELV